jgi:hypothetical protein
MDVPLSESSRSIIAQWCFPLTRQHAGRRDSWFNTGNAVAEANNNTNEVAISRRTEIEMKRQSYGIHADGS